MNAQKLAKTTEKNLIFFIPYEPTCSLIYLITEIAALALLPAASLACAWMVWVPALALRVFQV
jgi:hypothetical protein